MGANAVVVTLRRAVERGPVVGQTDDVLVARVRAGEDAAFEAIYDRYARGVLAFCAHMLGSREEAEDALQLTFVSAYRGLQRSKNEIALRPWIYTIARNRCLSELRIRREAVDADGVVAERPSSEGLADQVQRREDLRELVEDMQRLPDDQRAALVLFEMGDHSHKEIADVLGVRAEKVKALIFQAREGLVRGRRARDRPCLEIRELLATSEARVLPRSTARAHIERCPSCAAFEDEVARQRTALALILPVALGGELKTAVLSSVLGGGGAAGVGAAAAGGGGAVATTAIVGAPAVVASGIAAVAAATVGLGGADATRMMAKLLTAAAIATGAAGAGYDGTQSTAGPPALSRPAPATPATGPTIGLGHKTSPAAAVLGGSQHTVSTGPAQLAGPGTPATGSSPARGPFPALSSSAPASAGATQTGASSSPAAPRDLAGAGAGLTSSSPGQSGAAQGGPPSSPPGQSDGAQGGSPSSPPGQSNAAHGGPPSSPPGQSGVSQGGSPSSPPGQSGAAQGGGPPSSPPGQSGAAQGGPPATSGPPSNPADTSSPGNSGAAPGQTGTSNGHGGPPATRP